MHYSIRLQLLWILGVVAVLAAYAGLPVAPCPRNCGEPLAQLVGYTRLPGVTRKDAERMLAWGRSFPCRFCGKRRYLTLLRCTQEIYEALK